MPDRTLPIPPRASRNNLDKGPSVLEVEVDIL
jgi:hypothetical protein